MVSRYERELARLTDTYDRVRSEEINDLDELVNSALYSPVVFAGSGGALAVAEFAAELHRRTALRSATVATPLELASQPRSQSGQWIIFSAGARNPDTALAVQIALSRAGRATVVTQQRLDRIPDQVLRPGVRIVQIPAVKDGFLATNSVLAMSASLAKAYGYELPDQLPNLTLDPTQSERLGAGALVLWGPGTKSVAVDLEARLAEVGLTWVQLSDYRNLAHGRHVGLARRREDTSAIAVITDDYRELANRTLALLPEELHCVRLNSDLSFPSGTLDLLVSSMMAIESTAQSQGIDPARPGVSAWGRKLYHLRPRTTTMLDAEHGPVPRKIAAGAHQGDEHVGSALKEWIDAVREQSFEALVLDYDGTCCFTEERFEDPPEAVTGEWQRLLAGGVRIGFASGRGQSLYHLLRRAVPEGYWPQIIVGLYNGSVLLDLTEDLGDYSTPAPGIQAAIDHLADLIPSLDLEVEARQTQATISSQQLTGHELLTHVVPAIHRDGTSELRTVASGHSVDIVLGQAPKTDVISNLVGGRADAAFTIGDQGDIGGNDFYMLAATPWSVTVDTCSADLTRCWNLDREGLHGPDLLIKYLQSFTVDGGSMQFDPAIGRLL